MGEPADEALMARYRQGEAEAFDTLYDRYRDRVYGFLVRQLGDADRAAELFQETFLRLHDSRRRYDPARPFAPWLFRIARNLVTDARRRRGRAPVSPGDIDEAELGGQKAVADPVEEEQMNDQLRAALLCLPAPQREALTLSYFAGLKYAQIAAVVDTSEDAVKQRVRRGLAALRERLGTSGWTP